MATTATPPPAESLPAAVKPRPATADVAVYDRISNVPSFIDQLGEQIYRSTMFGCESPSQGKVMAMECIAKRLPPLSLAERYHLIKGKLSMKADAMLADFRRRGGKSKIVERSPERAAIKLALDGESQQFEITWEQAAREPFVYEGKEADTVTRLTAGQADKLKLKAKYATPRSRSQMLWARVVSDAVRAMAPEVVAGLYTPEELADVAESRGEVVAADGDGRQQAASQQTVPLNEQSRAQAAAEGLTFELQTDEAQQAAAVRDLAEAQQQAQQGSGEPAAAEGGPAEAPQQPADSSQPATNGRATAEQIAEAKRLATELQVDRTRLATMLGRAGAKRFSDLSQQHAEALLSIFRKEQARRAEEGAAKNP